jgi:hypothetical protein
MIESYVERSVAHKKLSWRNSMAAGKKLKSANNIGIWSMVGKQPLMGLTPTLPYNSMVAFWRSAALSDGIRAFI